MVNPRQHEEDINVEGRVNPHIVRSPLMSNDEVYPRERQERVNVEAWVNPRSEKSALAIAEMLAYGEPRVSRRNHR